MARCGTDSNGKLLFISHDASRTGAPILLLRFLRWLQEHSQREFSVLLRYGGDLEDEFNQLGDTQVLYPELKPRTDLAARVGYRLGRGVRPQADHLERLRARFTSTPPALIYANTVACGRPLDFLSSIPQVCCPIICHAHEMEFAIQTVGEADTRGTFTHARSYIAVSQAVRSNLLTRHLVQPEQVEVIPGFVPRELLPLAHLQEARARVRAELGMGVDELVVVGAGTPEWRKGTELFPQLAQRVKRLVGARPVRFLWVGGETGAPYLRSLGHDVRLLGMESVVQFLGQRGDPLEVFAASDVLALLSREDPFPLVGLEAASAGLPIMCFEDAGGMPDFVGQDCGYTVPYLDLDQMAARIAQLADDPVRARELGQSAAAKVRAQHTLSVIAPKLADAIERRLVEG